MTTWRRLALLVVAAALGVAASATRPAAGATITVTGACSLSDAILAANTDAPAGGCSAGAGADVIELTSDVTLAAIAYDSPEGPAGLPPIQGDVTIKGRGWSIQRDPSFTCPDPVNPSFRILVVAGGRLALERVTVRNGCSLAGDWDVGGGILVQHGALSLSRSTISGNAASIAGGIAVLAGSLIAVDSTLRGNTAGRSGGAVAIRAGTLALEDTVLADNTAAEAGGAIWIIGGTVTATGATLARNSAGQAGGAILAQFSGDLTITASRLVENSGGDLGGAIYARGGRTTVAGSRLAGNTAAFAGGALYVGDGASVTVDTSTIARNTAPRGGGTFVDRGGALHITGSTLSGNAADVGGGIDAQETSTVSISRSALLRNAATAEGGGFRNGGVASLTSVTVALNAAELGGGVVAAGPTTMTNVTLARNTASQAGGIALGTSNVRIGNSILANPSGRNCAFGRPISTGANLATDATCQLLHSIDQQGIDVGLGGLSDDGVPGHAHVPLRARSPAIDHGDVTRCPATDQLGAARIDDCDIGAVEFGRRTHSTLDRLLTATLFLGAVRPADHGRRVDARVEIYRNGQLVAAGETLDVPVGADSVDASTAVDVPLALPASVVFRVGDVLRSRVLVRARSTPDFRARLWFNAAVGPLSQRGWSNVDAVIDGFVTSFYYRDADEPDGRLRLDDEPGDATLSRSGPAGPEYRAFGTWRIVLVDD